MTKLNFFSVISVPNTGVDKNLLFETIGKHEFVLVYDFEKKVTHIGIEDANISDSFPENIADAIPGFSIERCEPNFSMDTAEIFCCYKQPTEENTLLPFNDIFYSGFKRGFVAIAFLPLDTIELAKSKTTVEHLLSSKNLKETSTGTKGVFNSKSSLSVHRELVDGSEERLLLEQILNSVNDSLLNNGMVYNVFIIADSDRSISDYLSSRMLILKNYRGIKATRLVDAIDGVRRLQSLPFGSSCAGTFLNFYGSHRLGYAIRTHLPYFDSGIELGTFLKDGASPSGIKVSIDPSSLNLGFIITGLPGSGKTREAMAVIDSLLSHPETKDKTSVVIISPTFEWNEFADSHGLYRIAINDNSVPINFFSCPAGVEKRVFYENLAMILSSASNAGPYQNPMEKCMLNAFRLVYANTDNPDPIHVYNEIENSVIKLHAKKSIAGVKYTKHGENIRSALENLRAILSLPQYSVLAGIKIGDMISKGVVFDLSKVSSSSKAYLYALILNQIYALVSCLDLNGDNELRILMCIEEAQLIFGTKDNAATQDIKQRIQDFRKQGVGILMLTHNVTDIDPSLRRLCQTKLYLKQAPDVAPIAVKDMVFTHSNDDDTVLKLKLLASGTGALSYVTKVGQQKLPNDTIFIATKQYQPPNHWTTAGITEYLKESGLKVPRFILSNISLKCYSEEDAKTISEVKALRIIYLNETIFEYSIENGHKAAELLEGKEYTVQLVGKRERILSETKVLAESSIVLEISGGNLTQTYIP